jgi:hypothetical protein
LGSGLGVKAFGSREEMMEVCDYRSRFKGFGERHHLVAVFLK